MAGIMTTMASPSRVRPIADEDIHLLPLVKIITSMGRDLMHRIFTYGCPCKDPHKTLKEYLQNDVGMSSTQYNKIFNNTMREQILANPACDMFDVSLLLHVIKVTCNSKMADKDSPEWLTKDDTKLEYLLKVLKDERNEIFHNLPKRTKAELLQKIEDMRTLLVKIVENTSVRFNIDLITRQQHLNELHLFVDQVRDQPLTETEILQYKELLWRDYVERTLKDKGAKELKEAFKKLDFINPLSFKDGYDTLIKLKSVFSELMIVHTDYSNKMVNIDYKSILQMVSSTTGKVACIILVKGVSGSGKTTLTKWLMLEWTKSNPEIMGLADYDLVVPFECRNYHIDSLTKLLKFLLPDICADLGEDIVPYILRLKVLFILDGLDELNANSSKVIQEIMHLCKTRQHTILYTSRPEKTREFLMTVPSDYQKCVLKITGISPPNQAIFAQSYHNQLVQQGRSKESSEDLMHYVEKSSQFQEFYRFPLNLVLLVYLWAYWPTKVNQVTTVTELYRLLYALLEEKLLQRLMGRDPTVFIELEELEEKVKEFRKYLSMEALISLSLGQIILQYPSKKRLKSIFSREEVTQFKEVASAFLAFRIVKKELREEEQLSFPHKDSHDYFAAQGLLLAITDRHFYTSLRTAVLSPMERAINLNQEYDDHSSGNEVIRHVLQVLSRSSLEISKYQNVLKHLAGLLVEQFHEAKKSVAQELVQLLKESGVTSHDQWLDIVAETKCDHQIGQYIANCFFKNEKNLLVVNTRVAGFASLMPYLRPSHVTLDLDADPNDLPHLKQLLKIISENECSVMLKLWRHYHNPDESNTSDQLLDCLLYQDARCQLDGVLGHLSGMGTTANLKLRELHVVLSSSQQAAAVSSSLLQQPHTLKEVRVMPGVAAESLHPLPHDGSEILLDLSQVTTGQVNWGCQVAQALTLNTRLSSVLLPDCNPSAEVGLLLEQELNKAGVSVERFLPFSYVEKTEQFLGVTDIKICDYDVEEMRKTMVFAWPERVTLDLTGNPADLPHLEQLLKLISEKKCNVEVKVWSHYTQPEDTTTTDDLLMCLLHQHSQCQVDNVLGHLSGMGTTANLKLRELHVVLSSDQQAAAVTSSLLQQPHTLKEVRVMPGVAADSLHPLPQDSSEILLDLSEVTSGQVNWGCQVAQSLSLNTRLSCVRLPDCNPSAKAGLLLEQKLNKAGVSVERFLPFSYIEKTEQFLGVTDINISDHNIEEKSETILFANPERVTLDLTGNPADFPCLEQLLELISEKECNVEVKLWQHYNRPIDSGTSDSLLMSLLHLHSRCQVDSVLGHLSGTGTTADLKLRELHVVLSSDQQAAAVTSSLLQQPHTLKEVRVMPGVAAASLHPLPQDGSENLLDLSQVTIGQVNWGCQVAQALALNSRLSCVCLPDWNPSAEAGLLLEKELNKTGVSVERFLPFSYVEKAQQFRGMTDISIKDPDVEKMILPLAFASPESVTLDLNGNPNELPHLEKLLKLISKKECHVLLKVWWHYTHRDNTTTESLLMWLLHQHSRCQLKTLNGLVSLDYMTRLPSSLTELWIPVTTDSHAELFTHLHSATLPHLEKLHVHVAPGVTPSSLTPLPAINVHLDLADLVPGREERACQVAVALQSPQPYSGLWFPRATVGEEGWRILVECLIKLGVRMKEGDMWGVVVPHTTPAHLVEELHIVTKAKLKANFRTWNFTDNDHWHSTTSEGGVADADACLGNPS